MKAFISILTLALLLCELHAEPSFDSGSCPWGIDSELYVLKRGDVKRESATAAQRACVAMIHFFQKKISPIDGPRSSFYPTSSQYALESIKEWGVLRGIAMGCDRLMRENSEPWVYGMIYKFDTLRKHDPIPKR